MVTAMIEANRIGQPTTSGTAIRFSRSTMNPLAPRRWKVRCAKKPAIRKKVVIRKVCSRLNSTPSVRLRWLSPMIQIECPAGAGRNDIVAWKITPAIRANPRTASRACSRSLLVSVMRLSMGGRVDRARHQRSLIDQLVCHVN